MEASAKVNNCTNCKYFNKVIGNVTYDGICNHAEHIGRLCSEYMFCSEYELDDRPVDEVAETLQALRCCSDPKFGCKDCSFKKYKHTCQRDLMIAAADIIDLLTIKVDSLTERFEDLKREADIGEYKLSEERIKNQELERLVNGYVTDQEIWIARNDYLEKENKQLWDSYHKGYAVGYGYGKQDALSADRAEPYSILESANPEHCDV